MNKTKTGVEKKLNDIEQRKKTEERLRDELNSLKNKYNSVLEQKESQINSLNGALMKQTQDKNNLELTLEELEQKLNEIDVVNKKRMDEYALACQKIQEFEEILENKEEIISNHAKEIESLMTNKEQEFAHLKKQAENMIRHLNSLQSTVKPTKIEKKPLESDKISLNQQLDQSLLRENQLKSLINEIISSESQNLKSLLTGLSKNTLVFRAETERWIMRNEELEQRVLELSEKNIKLNGFVKDFEKMIYFKNLQFDEFSKDSDTILKEMQAKIDFLSLELSNCYNMISKDLFPFSQKLFTNVLSPTHEKIHNLRQEISHFMSQNTSNNENLVQLNRIIKTLEDEKESISKLLYKSNASIVYIDKHIGDVLPLHSSIMDINELERLSIIPESEKIKTEITDQARKIITKLIVLKDNQQRYVDRLNQNDLEILQFSRNLKEKCDQAKILESSYVEIQEENRYLTEIALKEKEEKIKLKSILTELLAAKVPCGDYY